MLFYNYNQGVSLTKAYIASVSVASLGEGAMKVELHHVKSTTVQYSVSISTMCLFHTMPTC